MATRKNTTKAVAKKAEVAPALEPVARDDGETQAKSIVLPTWIWDALQQEADEEDRSLNKQVGRILRQHVEARAGK